MAITREDVLHLAKLSNISLSEEQIEPLKKDLDNIVGYISQLDELDTEGVEPTYQCFDMQNVWREDTIEEFEANREDLLELTVESEDNQIKEYYLCSCFLFSFSIKYTVGIKHNPMMIAAPKKMNLFG